jgi:hypothetical protein
LKTTHRIVLTDEYIAEAQRLAIAQNKPLKFVYQTWWSWWLPRVALLGFLIFCLANHFDWSVSATFGGFLVLSFVGEWIGRRSLAKARAKTRFKGSTTMFSMDENGVDLVGEAGNSHSKWMLMLPPAISANGVLVRFTRLGWIWLPDQSLVEGSPDDVRKLLAENARNSGSANK